MKDIEFLNEVNDRVVLSVDEPIYQSTERFIHTMSEQLELSPQQIKDALDFQYLARRQRQLARPLIEAFVRSHPYAEGMPAAQYAQELLQAHPGINASMVEAYFQEASKAADVATVETPEAPAAEATTEEAAVTPETVSSEASSADEVTCIGADGCFGTGAGHRGKTGSGAHRGNFRFKNCGSDPVQERRAAGCQRKLEEAGPRPAHQRKDHLLAVCHHRLPSGAGGAHQFLQLFHDLLLWSELYVGRAGGAAGPCGAVPVCRICHRAGAQCARLSARSGRPADPVPSFLKRLPKILLSSAFFDRADTVVKAMLHRCASLLE